MIWAIIAIAAVTGILVTLKGWAWMSARSAGAVRTVVKKGGEVWTTAESEIDDFVDAADMVYPSLKPLPLFWIAVMFSGAMIALDIHFGWHRGGGKVSIEALVYIMLFVGADMALPIITIKGDRGTAEWHSFKRSDRHAASWALIGLFTFMSAVVVIGSTGEVSTVTSARNQADVGSLTETKRLIEQKTKLRDELVTRRVQNGGQSREALQLRAKETAEAADREAARKYCGTKCEGLKAEAVKWKAQAADAEREEALNGELALLHTKLKSSDNLRTDDDPLARAAENIGIHPDTTRSWALTFLGVLFALGTTILWLIVGDAAGNARAMERERRGRIGDARRKMIGLPAKYTRAEEPTLLIENKTEATGDTIVINMAQRDMRARFANDADLLEVDNLLGTLLVADTDADVSISAVYRAYQIALLRENPEARYMTQPTMAGKWFTIAQHRDDVSVTADGVIKGWRLRGADEAKEAAE